MRSRIVMLVALLTLFVLPVFISQMKINGANAADVPPVAAFSYSPQIPTPGESVLFNASASFDADGSIILYAWDFGDGATSTSPSPVVAYSYPADGNYTVQLTVTDNSGSTGLCVAVVSVNCVVFFRVVYMGTLIPVPNVEVTAYYYDGSAWRPAPARQNGIEIKYDRMTQPDLANTNDERFRNPGYTASILRRDASNLGWDIHHANWKVYFKFKLLNSIIATWPNTTARVYSYKNGLTESHDYLPGHQAYWDPAAGTYVIEANEIAGHGVSPCESHPIIVGLSVPPPQTKYYLGVHTAPSGITSIPGEGLYVNGTDVTLTAPAYVNSSSTLRYRFSYWDIDASSRGSGVNTVVVRMGANHTATAHYVTQYSVSFAHTGLWSDASGTVVTANGVSKIYADLPYTLWVDSGSTVTYSYSSQISSTVSGKRYRMNAVSGPASPITVGSAASVTGNYAVQHSVTFSQAGLDSSATGTVVTVNGVAKVFSDLPYALWVDSGDSVTYSYSTPISSSVSGKRFRLSSITGPASPITVGAGSSVAGNYVIQYSATFSSSGLDSTTSGTVVTVNSVSKLKTDLPYVLWLDSGSSVTYSYNSVVLSTSPQKRFSLTGTSGPSSPITLLTPISVSGNFKIQHKVTIDQAGVGSDFTGTVVTIDSVGYPASGLPTSFWFDQSSPHSFSFASPLIVSVDKQYAWASTSGLSTLQSGSITVTAPGSVVGSYIVANRVVFEQVGIESDFTGTVLTVDGTPYGYGNLPVSFAWTIGSTHTFAYQSPLIVTPNAKRYVWTSTMGLASVQTGSITVTSFGSVIGNYRTQYYLNLASSPPGIGSPSGSGWYDAGATGPISTIQYVPGGSRYRFACWTTEDMSEIADPPSPSTTVLVDKPKTVTANYVHQYLVIFGQNGLAGDATSTVVVVNGTSIEYSGMPFGIWVDIGGTVTYSYQSTVTSSVPGREFRLTGVTGPVAPITVTDDAYLTGNYVTQTQYQVIFGQTSIGSDYTGPAVTIDGVDYAAADLPISFLWDSGSVHTFTYHTPLVVTAKAKQYTWTSTSGLSTLRTGSLTVASSGSVTGNYKAQYYLALKTNPGGVTSPTGEGWFDANTFAAVSIVGYVDVTPGLSRYRFNGWTTPDMSEITDPSVSPTTVLVDRAKTVTAQYVLQHKIVFSIDAGSDFTGTVLAVDDHDYVATDLPLQLWLDDGTSHMFVFQSPLVVSSSKRYVWTSTVGLSTSQSGTIVVTAFGNVSASYKTQYFVAVNSPYGSPAPGNAWFDAGASLTESIVSPVAGPAGTRYVCIGWIGTGSVPPSGSGTSTTFTITQASAITWAWKTRYYLSVATQPLGIIVIPGEGWLDSGGVVSLNAPAIGGFEFANWDVDGSSRGAGVAGISVTMNAPHAATAHYTVTTGFNLQINPMDITVHEGQTVLFMSTINGGTTPFHYQWLLNSHNVTGATSNSWEFVPTGLGTYYVKLVITDSLGLVAQSTNARVIVISPAVGGYSMSLDKHVSMINITGYLALVFLSGAFLSLMKRKRK